LTGATSCGRLHQRLDRDLHPWTSAAAGDGIWPHQRAGGLVVTQVHRRTPPPPLGPIVVGACQLRGVTVRAIQPVPGGQPNTGAVVRGDGVSASPTRSTSSAIS